MLLLVPDGPYMVKGTEFNSRALVIIFHAPVGIFLGFLLLWGIMVVGDSPQFSALTAESAPREFVGSALTIVTSIGFFITIVSIQFTSFFITFFGPEYIFLFLVAGPVFGLTNLWPLYRRHIQAGIQG
jgi:hypothetical protein